MTMIKKFIMTVIGGILFMIGLVLFLQNSRTLTKFENNQYHSNTDNFSVIAGKDVEALEPVYHEEQVLALLYQPLEYDTQINDTIFSKGTEIDLNVTNPVPTGTYRKSYSYSDDGVLQLIIFQKIN